MNARVDRGEIDELVSGTGSSTGQRVRSVLSHAYEAVVPEWRAASGTRKRRLRTVMESLETVIEAFVEAGLASRTEKIKELSKELTSVTDELNALKETIDALKQAAQITGKLLQTLTDLSAVL